MSLRVGKPGVGTDRPVLVVVVVAAVITAVGVVWLARAAVGERFPYRTIRVDNQAALGVQVDALDASGDRLGLGVAGPRATTTFREIADLGATWTFVHSYGGIEVSRQTISGAELADRSWTIQVPAAATADLERQGFR